MQTVDKSIHTLGQLTPNYNQKDYTATQPNEVVKILREVDINHYAIKKGNIETLPDHALTSYELGKLGPKKKLLGFEYGNPTEIHQLEPVELIKYIDPDTQETKYTFPDIKLDNDDDNADESIGEEADSMIAYCDIAIADFSTTLQRGMMGTQQRIIRKITQEDIARHPVTHILKRTRDHAIQLRNCSNSLQDRENIEIRKIWLGNFQSKANSRADSVLSTPDNEICQELKVRMEAINSLASDVSKDKEVGKLFIKLVNTINKWQKEVLKILVSGINAEHMNFQMLYECLGAQPPLLKKYENKINAVKTTALGQLFALLFCDLKQVASNAKSQPFASNPTSGAIKALMKSQFKGDLLNYLYSQGVGETMSFGTFLLLVALDEKKQAEFYSYFIDKPVQSKTFKNFIIYPVQENAGITPFLLYGVAKKGKNDEQAYTALEVLQSVMSCIAHLYQIKREAEQFKLQISDNQIAGQLGILHRKNAIQNRIALFKRLFKKACDATEMLKDRLGRFLESANDTSGNLRVNKEGRWERSVKLNLNREKAVSPGFNLIKGIKAGKVKSTGLETTIDCYINTISKTVNDITLTKLKDTWAHNRLMAQAFQQISDLEVHRVDLYKKLSGGIGINQYHESINKCDKAIQKNRDLIMALKQNQHYEDQKNREFIEHTIDSIDKVLNAKLIHTQVVLNEKKPSSCLTILPLPKSLLPVHHV